MFSERSQLSQPIPQFHVEWILQEWTPIARCEFRHNERKVYEDLSLGFGGRTDRQRTLVIRVAAITLASVSREWPRYCRKVYWTKMVHNGPNDDHFGQNDLIPNWLLASIRETKMDKWSILVHFGLKKSILVHLGPPTVRGPFLSFCDNSRAISPVNEIVAEFIQTAPNPVTVIATWEFSRNPTGAVTVTIFSSGHCPDCNRNPNELPQDKLWTVTILLAMVIRNRTKFHLHYMVYVELMRLVDAQIASDFKSNSLAIWNRSDFKLRFLRYFSTDLEAIRLRLCRALCDSNRAIYHWRRNYCILNSEMIKSCRKEELHYSGITTQHQENSCNCNRDIRGFQGKTAPILTLHYLIPPEIIWCKVSCNTQWPNRNTPLSRDKCSNTPVALCFVWYRRQSLLQCSYTPTSFHKNGRSQIQRQALGGRGLRFAAKACQRFRNLSGIFPDFLPESPSRTGGMAH